MKEELQRRQSSKERILALLQERGEADSDMLNKIAFRFGGRIEELRKAGYQIRTERIKDGLFRYVYEGKKTRPPADLNTIETGDGRLFDGVSRRSGTDPGRASDGKGIS